MLPPARNVREVACCVTSVIVKVTTLVHPCLVIETYFYMPSNDADRASGGEFVSA